MKRTVLIVAVAALCVAGSAVAEDRSGQWLGNGGRAEDGGQTLGSGGYLGSGTRSEASGLSVRQFRLLDGSSLLVVSWDEGMVAILIEE